MRISTALRATAITVCALTTTAALAEPPQWPKHQVSLSGKGALDKLRVSNPRHYAIARRILAAADEICDAARTGPIPAKFDAQDVFCARGFWLTSNPPKRFLQFRIEDTAYSALVVSRIPAPKFTDGPLRASPP